jgi:hypothetical protein
MFYPSDVNDKIEDFYKSLLRNPPAYGVIVTTGPTFITGKKRHKNIIELRSSYCYVNPYRISCGEEDTMFYQVRPAFNDVRRVARFNRNAMIPSEDD